MKTFMPNIVMIDFADYHKCHAIMELNRVAGHELTALARSDADQVELDF